MSGFITSVRVDHKRGAPHSYITVYIHGANCGTLCVREEEAEPLRALLTGDREKLDLIAAAAAKVMGLDKLAEHPELLEQVAESVQTEERRVHTAADRADLTPWMRGALDAMQPETVADAARRHGVQMQASWQPPTTGPERRAEHLLATSLAEAGQDVVLETEGREFHVDPSLDVDAMNRGRAAVGMPLLERKR